MVPDTRATPARRLDLTRCAEQPEPFRSFSENAGGVLQLLHRLTGLEVLLVTRIDVAADVQHVEAALVDGRPTSLSSPSWSGSVCVQMLDGGPYVVPRLADVPRYSCAPNLVGHRPVACYAGVPLQRGDGTAWGTLCGFGRAARDDDMQDVLAVFRLCARVLGGIITAGEVAEARLAAAVDAHAEQLDAALVDPVTGLANRTGLEHAVAQEQARQLRYGHVVTVVVCDVDGLKDVNDAEGHSAGDALLRRVGEALTSVSRASDVRGRLGGDEFLLLVPGEHHDGPAVQRLRGALAHLPVSLGAADSSDELDLHRVRAVADRRMYADKLARRAGQPVR